MLSLSHVISIIATLFLVTCVGIYSLKKVKDSKDFTVGRKKVNAPVVAGMVIGTLVGGAATIGTAQLAYEFGFSAWWFTLKCGIGCVLLGLFYAKPLNESGATTVPSILVNVYGEKAGLMASIFSSLGIFIHITAQILAIVALITTLMPIDPLIAAIVGSLLIVCYVVFGGVWGTGYVGMIKMFLLYFSMVTAGFVAYKLGGGISGFRASFDPFPWFSLFGRGVSIDLAAAFSTVVGVLSTQTYLQAIFSGRDVRAARRGTIVAGLVTPPIGFVCILIGLFMKASFPAIASKQALPLFIINYLPDWLGGIVIATLLISVIATGAGLVLGVSTMFTHDIYQRIIAPGAKDKNILLVSRLSIVAITGLSLLITLGNMDSFILQWSFLSMGLRGSTILLPLLGALFARKWVKSKAGTFAIALAPTVSTIWAILMPNKMDPLYIGLVISFLVLTVGSLVVFPKKHTKNIG